MLCGKADCAGSFAISHTPDTYMQGKIQIDPMITHVMPANEINNAFDLMKRENRSAAW
jgi:Zn-dependent alcohol dehydrogenase